MDKKEIKARLERIVSASEQVISVGGTNSLHNGQQLRGICQAVREIWSMINTEDESMQQRGDGT